MDVIVVLPNTTSETSGALNLMGPGGTIITVDPVIFKTLYFH